VKKPALLISTACLFLSALPLASSRSAPAVTGGTLNERYQHAQKALEEQRSHEDQTRAERDRLATETRDLQERLITNAAKVQELEGGYQMTAAELDRLKGTMRSIQERLTRDHDRVARLLAVLQRLEAEEPPALALKPDDSLSAARGAMQMGAMLPPVYREALELSKELKTLAQTRVAVTKTDDQARSQAEALRAARASLDKLLEQKSAEQANAEAKLADIHNVSEEIAREASDLKGLIDRIATLRASSGSTPETMTLVTPQRTGSATLARGSLRRPVIGMVTPGDPAGPGRTPGGNGPLGLWFEASGKAEAVAPADAEVVFAGNYQKFGQVLILEITGGYHLTLAGLGRIDVHIGDSVLAGEPVGILPEGTQSRLYMELRRNGQTVDPAPWLSAELRKAKGT
jgi:septal ring factor EnvC (AmiA/AmiB activator)